MKTVHTYKAHSRLGLLNIPHKQTEQNVGVEEGPDGILENFTLFAHSPIDAFRFSLPEKIQHEKYCSIIAKETLAFAKLIEKTIKPEETQVVLGGDHSVSLGSLVALFHRLNPKNIGYIQVDSHGDVHTISSSPSGNFHGMWMRPVVDEFDEASIHTLVPNKLPVGHMLYVGNLDLEPEETIFMDQHRIARVSRSTIRDTVFDSKKIFTSFMSRYDHIHISFDIDSFDQALVQATGIPCPDGLFWEDIEPLLGLLAKHPHISIDMVEVNPRKKGAHRTIALAQRVLKTLLL